jgi:hypothetical protein
MNRDPDLSEMANEKLLDLLVDDELDAARRRELLVQLEATATGWRQCALAFLEAQALSSDLQGAALEPHGGNPRPSSAVPDGRQIVRRLRHWTLLAASVTGAFIAGWILRPSPTRLATADAVAVAPSNGDQQQVADAHPASTGTMSAGTIEQGSQDAGPGTKRDPAGVRVTGILTLKFDDHGQEREMQLPVIDAAGIDVRHWLEQPSTVNAAAVKALERRGHKVESQRQLVTVSLKDGRRLLLPVDQVDVRFAHRVYQ